METVATMAAAIAFWSLPIQERVYPAVCRLLIEDASLLLFALKGVHHLSNAFMPFALPFESVFHESLVAARPYRTTGWTSNTVFEMTFGPQPLRACLTRRNVFNQHVRLE